MRKLLLDLFCCAGGAASGYVQAGFEVVGCDMYPQPHYPFQMFVDDALHCLDVLLCGEKWNGYYLSDFSAIHASPECKGYTNCNLSPKEQYQKLIAPVRERLIATGLPYVIENVVGAKSYMSANLLLCGSMFNLRMQRHRLFEISFAAETWLCPPRTCDHRNATIGVYGHSIWDSSLEGTPRKDGKRRPDSVSIEVGREAMGIDWMNIEELAEAIPPAYTLWIGLQIIAYLALKEVIEVKSIQQVSDETGISRFTISQAARRGSLGAAIEKSANGKAYRVNSEHPDFQAWLTAHAYQPRVKGKQNTTR